jgi:hypothetical protein
MKKYLIVAFVTFILTSLSSAGSWANGKSINLLDLNPTLLASFDKSIVVNTPDTLKFKQHGGRIVDGGIAGNYLSLGKDEYLTIDAKEIINPEEGTIIFWVRSNWSIEDNSSHTFISFSWDDERKGYFTISKGWWEKDGGRPYTYFIYNNVDSAKTEKIISYTSGEWVNIACTWRTGKEGFVRLYANGLLAAEGHKKPLMGPIRNGKLFIGADLGTPMSDGRWADAGIDEMAIFRRALSEEDILLIYNIQNPVKHEAVSSSKGKIYQTRAIFDEGRGWMTKVGADETIRRIKRGGFNVYIPCVWHGQGTRYPSAMAPSEQNLCFKDYDPLKYLIEIAHRNGIEVHPWFTIMLRQRDFFHGFYDYGTPENAFNVHNPQFRLFIVDIVLDLIQQYDVDGVNLDYVRTMGVCTSQSCIEQYKKQYQRNIYSDVLDRKLNKQPVQELLEWNENAVKEIVRTISEKAKKLKPKFIISVDGQPRPIQMKPDEQGRNEIMWLNEGLIDIVFSMDYAHIPDIERLRLVKKTLRNPNALVPLYSLYEHQKPKNNNTITPRSVRSALSLIKYTEQWAPIGYGFYLYSMLTDVHIEKVFSTQLHSLGPHWLINK